MTIRRRKSTNRKLRVKAKKSLGEAPWGRNDDRKKKNRQGQGGAKSSEVNVETRAERCSVNLF